MAARILMHTLKVDVILQDDGSKHAMPDLMIEYRDGRPPGFAEVVADMSQAYGRMWDKTIRADATPLPGQDRVWHLTVSVAVAGRTKELRAALPDLLAALTAKGLTFDHHHSEHQLARIDDQDVAILVAAGVVGIDSRPVREDESAEVTLGPQGVTGPITVDWVPVLAWLDDLLASPTLADVRTKLAKTGAAERHAVIGVTHSSPGDVVFALSRLHSSLPPRAPQLPDEITHLWLLGTWAGDRTLVWYPEHDWFDSRRRPNHL